MRFITISGAMMFGCGASALVGHLASITALYWWWSAPGMAVNTAVALAFGGAGLTTVGLCKLLPKP